MNRRHLLRQTSALAAGFLGLKTLSQQSAYGQSPRRYGPLQSDPNKLLDLPAGFRYVAISRTGEKMDDGLAVPPSHDGMGAFAGPNGRTIIVRNHELSPGAAPSKIYGDLARRKLLYDAGKGSTPGLGGTTTLHFNTKTQKLEKHFLSLAGTARNCAGGVTPWGSWISCEETVQRASSENALEQDHGFNFEVRAAQSGLVTPVPLKAMGRMNHEAITFNPAGNIVYQTEDAGDSLFYRFLPETPGELSKGGKLQALVVRDRPSLDTRNLTGSKTPVAVGQPLDCSWIDIADPLSPGNDLRHQGFQKGAARFSRGEGAWTSREAVWFVCTDGGSARKGQVWRYVPSPYEGRTEEARYPGRLELFFEPNDASIVDNPDNVVVAPWGDLFLCEDGPGQNGVVLVTPEGNASRFAMNSLNNSEMCGACFSPDGSTLFVNTQNPGITFAITGPWRG
jgi:uncharacterized protein